MRAHEFILNEKRRKKRKARSVAGPYYGYYYGLGAPTDSGTEGGDGGMAESQDDEINNLPSINLARQNISRILAAAQRIYDEWDESDRDTYAGGGICHIIADAICDVMWNIGIECTTVSCSYEQHVYVAVKVEEGVYTIDIPYSIYETGGGFNWQKKPDIKFDTGDVVFYRVSGDPEEFKNYNALEEGELIPWPKGTVKVDVSDVYDWYKLGQHISNLKGLGKHDFGKGPPQTVMAFGSEPLEHEYIKDLNKIGLKTYDIDENAEQKPKYVYRIDSEHIKDFEKSLKTYYHNKDFTISGRKDFEDSVDEIKGVYAADLLFTALYSTGSSEGDHKTRYVAIYGPGQPIVYFSNKDRDRIKNNISWLTVFDADNFFKVPSGEYFSKKPGAPVKQFKITDPFAYIKKRGWRIKFVEDLKQILKQIVKKSKTNQDLKFGAEGMGYMPMSESLGIIEGKMAELDMDLENPEISDSQFEKIYGMTRREARELFSKTNIWDFPQVKDPDRPLHEQGVAEGKLHESAIFLNPNTVIVGQVHGKPLELSPEISERVQTIAKKHGAWYEGNGMDRKFTKGIIDDYQGSWDDDLLSPSIKGYPYPFLYVLFSNIKANDTVKGKIGSDPKVTIFDRILNTQPSTNYFPDRTFSSEDLTKFLKSVSQGPYDFVKMSQAPATEKNVQKFFKIGEKLMWPENWEEYPNKAGQLAKRVNDLRDKFLASRKSGVYVVGSSHLIAVRDLVNKQGLAENNLTEFAPSPDYRDDDDRQDMPLLEFAEIIKLFLGSEYTMIDRKTPEQVSVKFYPKDKTSGHNGAVLYSKIGKKQNEYPTVNLQLIDYEQGPQVGRGRRAGTAILKTRANALKIADIIYNTMGLPEQDRQVKENFSRKKIPSHNYRLKETGPLKMVGQVATAHSGAKDVASRLQRGDYTGAGIGALSALANLKPGLGTAVSLGLDFINDQRDKQNNTTNSNNSSVTTMGTDEIKPISPEAPMQENFADGKNPGRKGLAKRMGVPTKASVTRLRQIAKSSSGEKQRMAHWLANMKAGKKK